MASPNFELITELQTCIRRDFPLAAAQSTILNPTDARPLVEGEWLELDSAYSLKRGGTGAGTPEEGLVAAVFPVHTELGRYDTQAIKKVNVIFLGMYEAETLLHPADLSTGYDIGTPLTVQNVSIGGIVRRGLAASAGTDERTVVGFVSKVTGSGASAKLRFVHFGNQKISAV